MGAGLVGIFEKVEMTQQVRTCLSKERVCIVLKGMMLLNFLRCTHLLRSLPLTEQVLSVVGAC